MYPHDHYCNDYPDLRYHGDNRAYVEADYLAGEADDQLPLISSIGAGPRGDGVTPVIRTNNDGNFSFDLVSQLTGETLLSSPNLSAGEISIRQPFVPRDGEMGQMDVTVSRGTQARTYTVALPCGATGSRAYLVSGGRVAEDSDVYRFNVNELIVDGNANWPDKPLPRVNDYILFTTQDKGIYALRFGNIVAVESGYVTVVSQTVVEYPVPKLGDDGYWYVGGVKTAVYAVGPKGDKGDKGDTGPQGRQGAKGDTGKQGPQGLPGEDGAPATMVVAGTTQVGPDYPAKVTMIKVSGEDNTYNLYFDIPQGVAGSAINVQGGFWDYTQLPDFDTTPLNMAFIVNDHDGRYDMYIRGQEPVSAELGGPWTVVEDWQGEQGATFTPCVDEAGILTWTNDKGLPNPDPVDLAKYGVYYRYTFEGDSAGNFSLVEHKYVNGVEVSA